MWKDDCSNMFMVLQSRRMHHVNWCYFWKQIAFSLLHVSNNYNTILYMVALHVFFLLPLICFNLYLLEPPVNTRYKKLCRGGVFSKINEVLLPSLLITCLQDPGFANIAQEFKYITLINVNTKRRVPTPAFRNREILQCTYLAERSS